MLTKQKFDELNKEAPTNYEDRKLYFGSEWENLSQYQQRHAADGGEILDPTPIEAAAEALRLPSIQDQIRRVVEEELSKRAGDLGMETIDEANDFVVEDEPELTSPYELKEMTDEQPLGNPEKKTDEIAGAKTKNVISPEKKVSNKTNSQAGSARPKGKPEPAQPDESEENDE